METRCQECGTPVGGEQAFCPKCGAVVGMAADSGTQGDEGWDMEDTMLGRPLPSAPAPKPSAAPAPGASHAAAAPAQSARGGNTALLAVIALVAVLLVGGLALLLFYLNSQG